MQPHLGPTLSSLALRPFARFPDRPAFCSEAGRVTCAAVADTVGRFQAVLAARGIGRGHRVPLLSANRWESWAAGLAAQALGAVTTCCGWRRRRAARPRTTSPAPRTPRH